MSQNRILKRVLFCVAYTSTGAFVSTRQILTAFPVTKEVHPDCNVFLFVLFDCTSEICKLLLHAKRTVTTRSSVHSYIHSFIHSFIHPVIHTPGKRGRHPRIGVTTTGTFAATPKQRCDQNKGGSVVLNKLPPSPSLLPPGLSDVKLRTETNCGTET